MNPQSQKGPFTHRLLVLGFSMLFGLLFYWLLGFVMNDIGDWPGPDYGELEEEMIAPALVETATSLDQEMKETDREARELQDRQKLLKDSIDTSRRTMDQLLDIQRLQIEKDAELSEDTQDAMSQSIQHFLASQQRHQELNDQVSQLNERMVGLRDQQRENNRLLDEERRPIREEHQARRDQHNLWIATLKLGVLTPLVLVVGLLYLRMCASPYAPLIYAAAAAVTLKALVVMHQHFPEEYFKYVLVAASLLVVGWVLVHLLRMVAQPKPAWLLKQRRYAYEAFLCPVCDYPIRRGPLKYLSWTRRSLRKAAAYAAPGAAPSPDGPYTCPACSTQLFESCESCQSIRHSLLPACESCGTVKEMGE